MSLEFSIPLKGELFAGRYRPIRPLGKGGMGEVYLVQDRMLDNEEVALKVLKKDFIENEKHIARFLREVKLARQVTHPAVVRTYDVGEVDGFYYFTMEYVVGESIQECLKRDGSISHERVCQYLVSLCEGLYQIHRLDIVHRDLKPANILITDSDDVKITDFGIARPGTSSLTHHDEIVGSTHYLAPEIWLGKELSSATDIYALGVVMYEMLTGCTPFDAENPAELMWKHLDVMPVPPSTLEPSVPPWLDQLALALMAKDHDQRPCNAHEIGEFLLRATAVEEVRATGDYLAPCEEESEVAHSAAGGDVFSPLPSIDEPIEDLIVDRLTGDDIPVLFPESEPMLEQEEKPQHSSLLSSLGSLPFQRRILRIMAGGAVVCVCISLLLFLAPDVLQILYRNVLRASRSSLFAGQIKAAMTLVLLSSFLSAPLLLIHIQTCNVRFALQEYLHGFGMLCGVFFLYVVIEGVLGGSFQGGLLVEQHINEVLAIGTLSLQAPFMQVLKGEALDALFLAVAILLYGCVVMNSLYSQSIRQFRFFSPHALMRCSALLLLLAVWSLIVNMTGLVGDSSLTWVFAGYSLEVQACEVISGLVFLVGILVASFVVQREGV